MSKDFLVHLHHMKDNIAIIRLAQKRGKEAFFNDVFVQNTILHCLQIIGEAARNLPKEYTEKHAFIPWAKIIALRNQIVHYYHGVDFETIWKIVESNLFDLENFIETTLKEAKK